MLIGFINRQDKSKMALRRMCLMPLYSLVLSKIQTPDNLNRHPHDIHSALSKHTLTSQSHTATLMVLTAAYSCTPGLLHHLITPAPATKPWKPAMLT